MHRESQRLNLDFHDSTAALLDEVKGLDPQGWVSHVNQNDYQGGWEVLALRCQAPYREAHPILQSFAIESGSDWVNLPLLQTCPVLHALVEALPFALKSLRLMRLQPGAYIKPHRDRGLCLEAGEARLHLPIQMDEGVSFHVDGRRLPMRAGELWYIDADREHWVRNQGPQARVNLVMDCLVNEALLNLFVPMEAAS